MGKVRGHPLLHLCFGEQGSDRAETGVRVGGSGEPLSVLAVVEEMSLRQAEAWCSLCPCRTDCYTAGVFSQLRSL